MLLFFGVKGECDLDRQKEDLKNSKQEQIELWDELVAAQNQANEVDRKLRIEVNKTKQLQLQIQAKNKQLEDCFGSSGKRARLCITNQELLDVLCLRQTPVVFQSIEH